MPLASNDKWFFEVHNGAQSFGLEVDKILHHEKSEYQDILIFENSLYGTVMVLDDAYMLSDIDEHMYHRAITGYGMQSVQGSGLSVLVIGAGDGGTVRDLLRDYNERISAVTMVEIDREVIDVSRKYFPQLVTELENPKLDLRCEDALKYIENCEADSFDLVLCDSTDPVGFAAGLIEEDFYQAIKRVLRDGGVYLCQSGSPFFQRAELTKAQSNLAKVFKQTHTYYSPMIVYPGSIWSYTAASDSELNTENIDIKEFILSEVEIERALVDGLQ